MRHPDTELFKDKIEVSLDGKQIFYLFFGGAVIASLVFVLGVMVGKRVEARAHVAMQPDTSATRDPLAALDELSASPSAALAFPSVLAGDDDGPLGPVDEALAARSAGDGAAEAARERAAGPAAARPAAKPKAIAAGPAAAAAVKPEAKKAAAAVKPEAEKAGAARPEAGEDKALAAGPAKREAKPEAKAKPEAEKAGAAKPGDESKPAGAARFTLQLSSFQSRAEADAFYDTLVEAGYEPYIVEAQVPDKGTFYRVRLGRYGSYQGAIDAKLAFEKRQNIIAYVTRLSRSS